MGKNTMIEIDANALILELAKKGLNPSEASEMIYASRPYLSWVISHETISCQKAKAVDKILGIPVERYRKYNMESPKAYIKSESDRALEKRLDSIEKKLDKIIEMWG